MQISSNAKLAAWRDDAVLFATEALGMELEPWQVEVLRAYQHGKPRTCMRAAKGCGKSAMLAAIGWHFLLFNADAKIAVTSITGDNLRDGLWTEFALWQAKCPLLQTAFDFTATRISAKESPQTWWMSARQWPRSASHDQQANTLAGLHATNLLFLVDEAGGIPDAVLAAADAGLATGGNTKLIIAGNPTHLSGPIYRACHQERTLWNVIEVTGDPDSQVRSQRISITWAREQIEKYGRDNPFVLVNVFGQFPPASFNALIGIDEVREAMKRRYWESDYSSAARILGVDVAREGADSSVVFSRQGLQTFMPQVYRNIDGTEGANLVARKWQSWSADACFVDNTGGFGSSWVDNLRRLGFYPIPIHFSEKSNNTRYFNKRTEMAVECVEWIKDGGALPDIPELAAALTQTTYSFKGDKMIIEPKELIKERLGYSPDHMDALMLTFALPVMGASAYNNSHPSDPYFSKDFNPLDSKYIEKQLQEHHEQMWSRDGQSQSDDWPMDTRGFYRQ